MGGGISKHAAACAPGFSLVELLIAISVLAVLAVGVPLAVGQRATATTRDAAAFDEAFTRQHSLAVHGREMRALIVDERGWRMAHKPGTDWQVSDFHHRWAGRVAYAIDGPRAVPGQPNILFLPNGQTSTFSISFRQAGTQAIRCEAEGWAGLECAAN